MNNFSQTIDYSGLRSESEKKEKLRTITKKEGQTSFEGGYFKLTNQTAA